MPATLHLPSGPVELRLPDRRTGHAVAALHASADTTSDRLDLQAAAIALCWPGTPPWLCAAAAELQSVRHALAEGGYMLRTATGEEAVALRASQLALRSRLAELEPLLAPPRPDDWRALAERVLDGLAVPPAVVYRVGAALITDASEAFFAGYLEYEALTARGFSPPPGGAPSPGGSAPLAAGEGTPSGG